MSIVIRQADLQRDRELLIEMLHRYLAPQLSAERFDWLYSKNPYGLARAWIAVDTSSEDVVGVASAFPRIFYVGDREELSFVFGDFCVHDQYRSLGPALQLQRACLTVVEEESASFCYDFPSLRMMAIYQRLGIPPSEQMVRLTKPLRVDRKVQDLLRSPVLSRGARVIGNAALALWDFHRKMREAPIDITLHSGLCGEEFSALARETRAYHGACIKRTAAYLNWRYLANPFARYEMITARTGKTLLAYAIFAQEGGDGLLVDLFGREESAFLFTLVMKVSMLLRNRGASAVNVALVDSHPWLTFFQQAGFKVREGKPIVIYTPPNPRMLPSFGEKQKWLLLHGDRDS